MVFVVYAGKRSSDTEPDRGVPLTRTRRGATRHFDLSLAMSADLSKFKMIAVGEVAQLLSVSADTILRLGQRGELAIIKVGDRRLIRLVDLAEYQERQILSWRAEVELNKRLGEAGRTPRRKRGRPRKILIHP